MLNMDNAENSKPAEDNQNTVLALRAALRASIHKQIAALNKAPSPDAASVLAKVINDLCDAYDAIVPLFPSGGTRACRRRWTETQYILTSAVYRVR